MKRYYVRANCPFFFVKISVLKSMCSDILRASSEKFRSRQGSLQSRVSDHGLEGSVPVAVGEAQVVHRQYRLAKP